MNGTSLALTASRLALVGAALAALTPAAAARAADTIEAGYCDPASGSLPTIQQALDTAQPGDTIEVCPGVYHEQLTVTQHDVKVVSRDGPAETVIAPASYYGFFVKAPNVTIGDATHGFTITSTEIAIDLAADDPGVETSGARVEGNTLAGFGDVGVSIDAGADDVEVVANTITQTVFTSLVSQAGIAVNADGNPNHQTPTHRAQILDNTIVASPGLGTVPSDGLPSGSSLTSGIAVWQAGGSHVIAGNEVRGTWVGVDLGPGVRGAEVYDNDVGPAGGDAAASAPDRYVALSDETEGGVLALGLRNVWHDNTCSPAYQASVPAGLCALHGTPPTPAALHPVELVEGIPAVLTAEGTGPGLAKSRIKLGGDAQDPDGYDAFDQSHPVEAASVPADGTQTVHVQGRNDGAGERPISQPVTFEVPVRRNEVPVATADGSLELTEDGPARGIVLGARKRG